MKLNKNKRVISTALAIMVVISLTGCQPTPEKPFINGENDLGSNNPQVKYSRDETPKTANETMQKGNLSLDIVAEVSVPDSEDFYLYPADNFDYSSEEFQTKAVKVFFGADNIDKVEVEKNENSGYNHYVQKINNYESALSIEYQKHIATFISHINQSPLDYSEANLYAENEAIDIGMSETQAIEMAQNTMDGLGFEGYVCRRVSMFGKLDDHKNDFYEIIFSRDVDGAEILSVNARYPIHNSSPSNDVIMVTVGVGGLRRVSISATELSQKTEKVAIVSFQDALSSFKQAGIAKLSETLAQGTKYTVTKIQLAYIYTHSENAPQGLMLIPAWVFICKGEDKLDNGEIVTFYTNIAVDGINGNVLN